jgi:hypothetical protein
MHCTREKWPADEVLAVFRLRVAKLDVRSGTPVGERAYLTQMIGIVRALAAEAGWSPEELVHAIRAPARRLESARRSYVRR